MTASAAGSGETVAVSGALGTSASANPLCGRIQGVSATSSLNRLEATGSWTA